MASLIKGKDGSKAIQWSDGNGGRPMVYLGKTTVKAAGTIRLHVEDLVHASIAGTSPKPATSAWVAGLSDQFHRKLERVGLVQPREKADPTELGAFLEAYIASRTDLKPNTIRHLNDVKRKMIEYFGAGKDLASITPADGDEFRLWLSERVGPNSVRRWMGRAKQLLKQAVRKRLIPENPFQDQADTSVRPNRERDHFISREDAQKVIDACPNVEWRVIVALSRFGGLRCPSEHLALRWEDVDWANNRLHVRSPKTEHHEGRDSRVIPLFPELKEALDEAWTLLGDDSAEFVITPLPGREPEPTNAVPTDHQAGGVEALAQAVRQSASHQGHGTGRRVPRPRRAGLVGPYGSDRPQVLPAGHGRSLPQGLFRYCEFRCGTQRKRNANRCQ